MTIVKVINAIKNINSLSIKLLEIPKGIISFIDIKNNPLPIHIKNPSFIKLRINILNIFALKITFKSIVFKIITIIKNKKDENMVI